MKKVISLILSVLLLVASALPAFANTPAFVIKPGDLNEDERVTTADARAALRAAIGIDTLSAYQLWLADLNGSGGVETGDARAILRIAIGLDALPALPKHADHVWDAGEITVAPGCETAGQKIFTCTVCGETRAEPIPSKGGHAWDAGEVTVAPGCETPGRKTYTCTACGMTRAEPILPKGGHVWDAGEVTVAPGCETAGEKTYTCSVCGETRAEALPAAGHTWVFDHAVTPATWFHNGVEWVHCAVCGKETSRSLSALGEGREDDRADRLLAFLKAHGETDGSVITYGFVYMDGPYLQLSYDEAAPENGFLFTVEQTSKEQEDWITVTNTLSMSLTLLPPFSSYEGAYGFKQNKLTMFLCSFSIPDPAAFRKVNDVLGFDLTVEKNLTGAEERYFRNEIGGTVQELLYILEQNLKENEADFSVITDLGFAHLNEWKP